MKNAKMAIAALVIFSFALGLYFYDRMPESIASHWNARGQVDGYMPKFWGVFFMPLLSVFLAALFIIIPLIDPMKKNIEDFRDYYDKFILLVLAFMLYIYALTLAWNLGYKLNMLAFMSPGFAILFYYSGVMMEHAKVNWFIGIRTPWTMSSERVWKKTHALGAKLFKASGALAILGAFAGDYAILFVMVPVVLGSLYLFVYSYLEFQNEQKEKGKKPKKR